MSITSIDNAPLSSPGPILSSGKPDWMPTADKIAKVVLPVLVMAAAAFIAAPEKFYASILPTAFFAVGLALAFLASYSDDSTHLPYRIEKNVTDSLQKSRDESAEEREESEKIAQKKQEETKKTLENQSRKNMLVPGEIHTEVGTRAG